MKVLNLKRVEMFHPHGIFGVLEDENEPFCVTIENRKYLNPIGEYLMKPCIYYGGDGVGGKADYPTYEIVVPGKTEVKVHKGNYDFDSKACLIIAEQFAVLKGRTGIGMSQDAYIEFMNRMAGDKEAKLVIKEWKD